ncbi:COQ9 family protein [Rubellimicrobium aerolatum]|uniref:COQ9 family protein n=1 Tax=Rubellimicrobium aerolatum TaxID=490979 RepID=A0ABW0SFF7_9RHOB|nr:COQ9 family protein [Rubellimicrobium aerolatum]MBP1806520.1 ubiquinone biosynthesis protein COQ9 [Rubellimicrobium aerolatum]
MTDDDPATDFGTDPTRGALLKAILPHVPFEGWSDRAFAAAAREAEVTLAEAQAAAPRGALDLAVEWHRQGDRRMLRALHDADPSTLRMRDRIAFALKARMQALPEREALRRSASLFALPSHAALGARLLWETADAIWTALGDSSRDGNWYSKRATLAAVLASVVLYRLSDDSPRLERTNAFIDRRIDGVMAFEKWKAEARDNPMLRPLARPLGWIMGQIRAPGRPADLPGGWRQED